MPGNHDARDNLRAAFPDHPYLRTGSNFCHSVDESWPLRLIGLDPIEPGLVEGVMCADRLAWLDRVLVARHETSTLVFAHHPPFATGIAHMDGSPMRGADAFAAVIQRHRQVERVISGHVHRSMSARWGGTLCTTCPSTAHQFALDLGAAMPARWTSEPPGFQLHHWRPAAGFVTHTGLIGEFATRPLRHWEPGHKRKRRIRRSAVLPSRLRPCGSAHFDRHGFGALLGSQHFHAHSLARIE